MTNKSWLPHYRLAIRYASSFNNQYKYDLAHNAWLSHYHNYGEDLFDLDYPSYPSFLYRAIKWSFSHWKEKEVYHLKTGPNTPDKLPSADDPLQALITKDLYDQLYNKLFLATGPRTQRDYKNRERALNILKLITQGYTQTDIGEILGVSRQVIKFYVNKIRSMSSLNPFHGSRLEVKKTITESQWEKRIDREDYDIEDENEYYRLAQHRESKEGLLIRLRTPDKNPYIK